MDATPAFGKRIVGGLPRAMPVQDRRRGYLEHHGRHYYRQKWTARIRALQSVDEAVASLYATLDTLGETDNTYVVFTSDNGYSLGEHRLYRKNVLTTEALRVPLLVTGPGVRPGSTSPLPVSLVDLVATLADLASVTPGLRVDGASFAPTLRGADQTWRNATLIQTGSTRTRGRHPGWAMRGVRTSRFTFASDVGRGGRLLFDRTRDPHELVNRAGDPRYRKVERRLRRVTAALVRCRGAQCHRTFAGVTGLRPDRR